MNPNRLKFLGAVGIAFASGLVFAAGFDLTRFGFAQANAPVRTASLTSAPPSVAELNSSFVGIAERVTPAVVSIAAERTVTASQRNQQRRPNVPQGLEEFFQQFDPRQQQQPQASSGSGFIVSADGYVLTNNHVVENFDRIRVTLTDNRQFPARLIGRDPQTDVAVLKIDATGLPVAPLGNDEVVKVGEWVLAVGNPLGLDHTVTAGIVSAKGRGGTELPDLQRDRLAIQDFIQTDAAINPGNSGGPLVNIRGEVIGINSAIATRTGYYQGYGFAIPINLARDVMDDLVKNGRVRRAVIGVVISEVTQEDARAMGLKEISGVKVGGFSPMPANPARAAGLEPGDVIVKADGRVADRVSTLQRIIRSHEPGESVDLEVIRFGERKNLRVRLVEAPPDSAEAVAAAENERSDRSTPGARSGTINVSTLGMEVQDVTPDFVRATGLPAQYREGARVMSVERNLRTLFRGNGAEVVTAVLYPRPRRDVKSAAELRDALSGLKEGDSVSLLVYDLQLQGTRVVSVTVGEQ
jgi:serine protease Do